MTVRKSPTMCNRRLKNTIYDIIPIYPPDISLQYIYQKINKNKHNKSTKINPFM